MSSDQAAVLGVPNPLPGLLAALATAGLALAAGPDGDRGRLLAVVAPAGVVGVSLVLGVV